MRVTKPLVVAAVVSSLVLGACVLPERDNANDPQLRPTADLAVSNSAFVDGACSATDLDLTSVFSRGRCLRLDATGTSDPQDDVVNYVFYMGTSGILGESATGVLTVAPAFLRTLPVERDYYVRVVAIDAEGNSHEFPAPADEEKPLFRLTNNPPVAIPPGPRVVPNIGAAWTPTGIPNDIPGLRAHFTAAASFDEDGDPLSYCWALIAPETAAFIHEANPPILSGEICSPNPALVLTLKQGSLSAIPLRLTVYDGATLGPGVPNPFSVGRSSPLFVNAVLGRLPVWASEPDSENGFLLDLDRLNVPPIDEMDTIPTFLFDTAGSATRAIFPVNGGETLRSKQVFGTGEIDGTIPDLGARPLGLFAARNAGVLWVVAEVGGMMRLYAFDANTMAYRDSWDPPAADAAVVNNDAPWMKADPVTGTFWFGQVLGDVVFGLRWNPQTSAIEEVDEIRVDTGNIVTSLELRPVQGEREVWVAQSKNVLSEGETIPASVIVRMPSGQLAEYVFDTEVPVAWGLEFLTGTTAFVSFFGSGVGVVEREEPDALGNGVLSIRNLLETGVHLRQSVDPRSGTYFLLSASRRRITRATVDSITSIDTDTRTEALIPDPLGTVWTVTQEDGPTGQVVKLTNGAGSGAEGIALAAPLPPTFGVPAVDYSSGDLWVPTIFPRGATRIYTDGRTADFIEGVATSTAATPIFPAPPGALATDPETGLLWIMSGSLPGEQALATSVYVVDPYAFRGTRPAVAISPGNVVNPVIDQADLGNEIILRAASEPDHTLVLLTGESVASNTRARFRLRKVSMTAGLLPAAPIVGELNAPLSTFGNDRTPQLARDLADGGVCVTWGRPVLGDPGQITGPYVRRFTSALVPDGPEVEISTNRTRLRASAAALRECWVGYTDSQFAQVEHLARVRIDGTVLLEKPGAEPPVILSLRPRSFTLRDFTNQSAIDSQEVWAGGEDGALRRYVVTLGTAGVFELQGRDQLDMPDPVRVVLP